MNSQDPAVFITASDYMDAKRAAAYCGVSVSLINTAVREQKLRSVGLRGGSGARMFSREDLDAWQRGEVPDTATAGESIE